MEKSKISSKMTIPEWNEMDRPREKFLNKGAAALSDAELVAILLRSGTQTDSAVDVAKQLLAQCDNQLNRLAEMSVAQLTKIQGIGQVKALTIQAALELGARLRAEKVTQKKKILSSDDLWELMCEKISRLPHEEFWAIYVNKSATILATEKIGKGGIDATVVDIRLIMQKAIELGATGLFVCHNHPSNNLQPSTQDIQLTKRIKDAAEIFSIDLIDHLIIGKQNYYSFKAEGKA